MSDTDKISKEVRILAAMSYGEASPKDVAEEIGAIANVLVRQRKARGYLDMNTFVTSDKTFSFVVKDGNARYKKFTKASEAAIAKDAGMTAALNAAKQALANDGKDLSNGGSVRKPWKWPGTTTSTFPPPRMAVRFSGSTTRHIWKPPARRNTSEDTACWTTSGRPLRAGRRQAEPCRSGRLPAVIFRQ